MKRMLILTPLILVFVVIIVFSVFTFRVGPLVESIKERYESEFKNISADTEWLVSINDEYKMTPENTEKDRGFIVNWYSGRENYKNNMNDVAFKKLHIENAVNQNLIIIQALKEKALDSSDFDNFIWITVRDAIVQYYLTTTLKKDAPGALNIDVEEKEVKAFYERYMKNISVPGLSENQAKDQIRQILTRQRKAIILKEFESKIINRLKLNNTIQLAE